MLLGLLLYVHFINRWQGSAPFGLFSYSGSQTAYPARRRHRACNACPIVVSFPTVAI
jgi:hypothetical protein